MPGDFTEFDVFSRLLKLDNPTFTKSPPRKKIDGWSKGFKRIHGNPTKIVSVRTLVVPAIYPAGNRRKCS